MKKLTVGFLLAVLFACFLTGPLAAATLPAVGGQLPDFTLPAPKDSADKSYLGVSGLLFSGPFKIPQIKASVVIDRRNLQHVLPLLPGRGAQSKQTLQQD